jgi:hypothetical protein
MATGAPKPGGYTAPAPGGLRAIPAAGTDLNSNTLRGHLEGFPAVDHDGPASASGARVAVSRTVANVRRGRASNGSAPTYNWTLPTKPGSSVAVVTGGTTATGSFTPDMAGTYVLRVAVTFSDTTVITKDYTYISA